MQRYARQAAFAAALALVMAACAPSDDAAAPESEVNALPPEVIAAVHEARPEMVIDEFEYKEREDRRYYDVEGHLPNGDEIELDLLGVGDAWQVVEIQRDLAWESVPEPVQTAAASTPDAFTPVRVIESEQAETGDIIFELFREGEPDRPALEVRWANDEASILTEENPH